MPAREDWPRGFAETMGWLPAGPILLRLDVAERIAGEIGHLTRRAPAMLPGDLASRLGVKGDVLGPVLDAMGFRLMPAEVLEEKAFGPPAPARIAHARPARPEHHRGPRREGGAPDQNRGPRRDNEARGPGREGEARGPRRGDRRGPRPDQRPADAPAGTPAAEGAAPAEAGAEAPPAPRQDPRPPRPDNRPPRDQQRQGKGGGYQGDRDRDRGPRRPREERPALPSMPRPDSPFAVLANLLKKD